VVKFVPVLMFYSQFIRECRCKTGNTFRGTNICTIAELSLLRLTLVS